MQALADARNEFASVASKHRLHLQPAAIKVLVRHVADTVALGDRHDLVRSLVERCVGEVRRSGTSAMVVDLPLAQRVLDALASEAARGGTADDSTPRLVKAPGLVVDPQTLSVVVSMPPQRVARSDALQAVLFLALARRAVSQAAHGGVPPPTDSREQQPVLHVARLRSLEGQPLGSVVEALGIITSGLPRGASTDCTAPLTFTVEDIETRMTVEGNPTQRSYGYITPGMPVVIRGVWNGKLLQQATLSHMPVDTVAHRAGATPINDLESVFGVDPLLLAQHTRTDSSSGRSNGNKALRIPPSRSGAGVGRPRIPESAAVAIVSGCRLDDRGTLEGIRMLFETCEAQIHALDADSLTFVLCGDFVSLTSGQPSSSTSDLRRYAYADPGFLDGGSDPQTGYQQLFEALASLIASAAPTIAARSQIIFVPGPNDPTPSAGAFPSRPLSPAFVGKRVDNKLPHARFASNPCRIKTGTHELLVVRHDLHRRFANAAVVPPSMECPEFEHVAAAIVGSGQLVPLEVGNTGRGACPTNWKDAHELRVYPLPHAICVCDASTEWQHHAAPECNVFNPGPFHATRTFAWFTPAQNSVEFNRVG